MRDKNVRL